jgi:hypothetical protein
MLGPKNYDLKLVKKILYFLNLVGVLLVPFDVPRFPLESFFNWAFN